MVNHPRESELVFFFLFFFFLVSGFSLCVFILRKAAYGEGEKTNQSKEKTLVASVRLQRGIAESAMHQPRRTFKVVQR